jgi:hypothetical protein
LVAAVECLIEGADVAGADRANVLRAGLLGVLDEAVPTL